MTIQSNDDLKAALVAKLKSEDTILAQLKDTNEIREAQWQADNFSYPNIRVRAITNVPSQLDCGYSTVTMGIAVFSEEDSSQEADRIAGIIANRLHTQSFTSVAIKFTNLLVTNLNPAIRIDEQTWMSELILSGRASG